MFRYIGIVWNSRYGHQNRAARQLVAALLERAPAWQRILQSAGLAVFCADSRRDASEPLVLHGNAGVVLGTLFPRPGDDERSDPARRAILDSVASERIERSEGRHLVTSYWGRYVAFLKRDGGQGVVVLRDPTGGLPCLRIRHKGVNLFCSRAEDCSGLGLARFTINWDYVAAHTVFPFLLSNESGLNEVSQLAPGHALTLGAAGETTSSYWNAAAIANSDPLEHPEAAAIELRRMTRYCTRAWGARHTRVLHHLSGGLDSSIVLGCLRSALGGPRVTCVNYYSADGDGDERRYARLISRRFGCPLVESARDPSADLRKLLRIGLTACPQPIRNRNVDVDALEARWASETGATASFGGEGGDQLFYQNPAMLAAADYANAHGLDRGFLRVAFHAAQLGNMSIWEVMRGAWSTRHRGRSKSLADVACTPFRLVSRTTLETLHGSTRFRLSNLPADAALPPGKRHQIDLLAIPQAFYSPFARCGDPEPVEPLASQPLVELCLRIPTYLAVQGGWDRAVARAAFAAEVPAEILWRRTKGGIDTYVKDALRRNSTFVREMLLDGLLVQRGLLDRQLLEQALGDQRIRSRAGSAEVFDHLTTEAWLRRWHDYSETGCGNPELRTSPRVEETHAPIEVASKSR